MITSRDVYAAAQLLRKQYGSEASAFAARSADHLALKGDRAGAAVWLRVSRVVKQLEGLRQTAAWSADHAAAQPPTRHAGRPAVANS